MYQFVGWGGVMKLCVPFTPRNIILETLNLIDYQ
jgi:hypothetical protein